jgi:hypothetical protein
MRTERNAWREQAQCLALPNPDPARTLYPTLWRVPRSKSKRNCIDRARL